MTWDAWLALISVVVFFVTFGSLIYLDRIEMKDRFCAWFVQKFGIGEYITYRAEQSIEGLIPTGKMAEIEGRLSQLIDEIEAQKEAKDNLATACRRMSRDIQAHSRILESMPTTPTPRRD